MHVVSTLFGLECRMDNSLFPRLPKDLQRAVARYLPLWQRRGLHRPLPVYDCTVQDVDACPHSRYYRTIRRCPRGARWDRQWPTDLYVRRQAHVFAWTLQARTLSFKEDEWVLRMRPQFRIDAATSLAMSSFMHAMLGARWWRDLFLDVVSDVADVASVEAWVKEPPPRRLDGHMTFAVNVERASMLGPPTRQCCAQRMVDLTRALDDAMQQQWVAYNQKKH